MMKFHIWDLGYIFISLINGVKIRPLEVSKQYLKVLTCTSKVLRPPTELLPADYQNKSFEHGNLTPM